ncbi:histidine phosphatase family protein, partial [Candidatus Micrarchaeota archaeon]|nr:histidine phosphatase family protein [Candidatus Micrarchaeota archaeon]
PIPLGETLFDVQARALPEFEKIVKKHKGQTIVIVTHYCVLNVLICALIASLANFRSFDSGTGTVAELELNNVPRLKSYTMHEKNRKKAR